MKSSRRKSPVKPEERNKFEAAIVAGLMPGSFAGYKLLPAEEKTRGGLVLPAQAGASHAQDGSAFVVIGVSPVYTDTAGKAVEGCLNLPEPGSIVFCRSNREWKHPHIKAGVSYAVTCQCIAHIDLDGDPYYSLVKDVQRTEGDETVADCVSRIKAAEKENRRMP